MSANLRIDEAQFALHTPPQIQEVVTREYNPSRPKLPPPGVVTRTERLTQEQAMKEILDLVLNVHEATLQNRKETLDRSVDDLGKEQERLDNEQRVLARKQKTAGFWGFLKKVFTYVFAGISIVLGGVLAALGGPAGIVAGSLMMASGATAITGQILADAGIASEVTGALALTGAILGLVGSGVSFGVLSSSVPMLVSTIASSIGNVTEGSMTIGTAIAMNQVHHTEANVIGIRQKSTLDQSDIKWLSDAIKRESKKLIQSQEGLVDVTSRNIALRAAIAKNR